MSDWVWTVKPVQLAGAIASLCQAASWPFSTFVRLPDAS
jgi:hypothetical protein